MYIYIADEIQQKIILIDNKMVLFPDIVKCHISVF